MRSLTLISALLSVALASANHEKRGVVLISSAPPHPPAYSAPPPSSSAPGSYSSASWVGSWSNAWGSSAVPSSTNAPWNPPSTPYIDPAGISYDIYEDSALVGSPLLRRKRDVSTDTANCVSQCSSNPQCTAVVEDDEGSCTLYSSFSSFVQQLGSTVGVKVITQPSSSSNWYPKSSSPVNSNGPAPPIYSVPPPPSNPSTPWGPSAPIPSSTSAPWNPPSTTYTDPSGTSYDVMEDTAVDGSPLLRRKRDVSADTASCIALCSGNSQCVAIVEDAGGCTLYSRYLTLVQRTGSTCAVKVVTSEPSSSAPYVSSSASFSASAEVPSSSSVPFPPMPACWTECFAEAGNPSQSELCGNTGVNACIYETCSREDDKAYWMWYNDYCGVSSSSSWSAIPSVSASSSSWSKIPTASASSSWVPSSSWKASSSSWIAPVSASSSSWGAPSSSVPVSSSAPYPLPSMPACWTECFANAGHPSQSELCGNADVSACIHDTCSTDEDRLYWSWYNSYCGVSSSSSWVAPVSASSSSEPVSSSWGASSSSYEVSSSSWVPSSSWGASSSSWAAPVSTSSSWGAPSSSAQVSSSAAPHPSFPAMPDCWKSCFAENGNPSQSHLCGNSEVSGCIHETCSPEDDQSYWWWYLDYCGFTSSSSSSVWVAPVSVSSSWGYSSAPSASSSWGYSSAPSASSSWGYSSSWIPSASISSSWAYVSSSSAPSASSWDETVSASSWAYSSSWSASWPSAPSSSSWDAPVSASSWGYSSSSWGAVPYPSVSSSWVEPPSSSWSAIAYPSVSSWAEPISASSWSAIAYPSVSSWADPAPASSWSAIAYPSASGSTPAYPVSSSPAEPSSIPSCWSTCFAKAAISSESELCGNTKVSNCICFSCNPAEDKAYKTWYKSFCKVEPPPPPPGYPVDPSYPDEPEAPPHYEPGSYHHDPSHYDPTHYGERPQYGPEHEEGEYPSGFRWRWWHGKGRKHHAWWRHYWKTHHHGHKKPVHAPAHESHPQQESDSSWLSNPWARLGEMIRNGLNKPKAKEGWDHARGGW